LYELIVSFKLQGGIPLNFPPIRFAWVETAVALPLGQFLVAVFFAFSMTHYQKMELEGAVSTCGRAMLAPTLQ
jgi:hypothetical protein